MGNEWERIVERRKDQIILETHEELQRSQPLRLVADDQIRID